LKKKVLKLIALLFPNLIVRKAYVHLTTPRQVLIRPEEHKIREQAQKSVFKFNDFSIQLFQWGSGEKKILLVHGWEGNAGNFSKLIPLLTRQGFTVLSFDGPSHGASSQGATNMFQFIELVSVLVKKYSIKYLISHSFGSVASLIALGQNPDLVIKKYIGITVPNKFRDRIEEMNSWLGFPPIVAEKLIKKIETNHGIKVDDINVADFALKANVEKALLLHDTNDRVLPVEKTIEVAKNWSVAKLEQVTGTGHFKILGVDKVTQRIIDFLEE